MKGLSWPGWLTCSGRFTHISGYPSTISRAQDRESLPVFCHCATQPSNYLGCSSWHWDWWERML